MESGKAASMKMLIGSLLTKAERHFFAIIAGVLLVSVPSLCASPVQLLSARNPAVALPAGGNGDSVAPWISDDGGYVVFSSLANDLTPGGNSQQVLNVYLYDCSLNTTVLVSANTSGTGGGNGHSTAGQASADGRYVVFQSDASDLLPGDTNGVTDIFLRDTFTGITVLINVAADGGFANVASTEPVMTPDGTCVAFISAATNLVAGDTNGIPGVFVRDLITQTTSLVSVNAVGTGSPPAATMDTPVITPDGRFVAFFSTATNLAPGVPAITQGEIYVRDLLAGTTIWASTNAAMTVSNLLHLNSMPSTHPVISDDGRYIAFKNRLDERDYLPRRYGRGGGDLFSVRLGDRHDHNIEHQRLRALGKLRRCLRSSDDAGRGICRLCAARAGREHELLQCSSVEPANRHECAGEREPERFVADEQHVAHPGLEPGWALRDVSQRCHQPGEQHRFQRPAYLSPGPANRHHRAVGRGYERHRFGG